MTTTETPPATVPTAYDVAMLIIDALPQFRVRDGHHFDSIGTTLRRVEHGVEIDCDVTFDYFAADARPVHFVLRVSDPELVDVEGAEIGAPA